MAENFRRNLYPKYKRKKKKIHPDDVAPEVGHKQELDKRQAVQDADMEEGAYLKDPETEVDTSQPLQSSTNPLDDLTINKGRFKKDARQRKIRNIAEQGATAGEKEAGKRKLKDQTDLPQFLQVHQDADDIIKEGIAEDQKKYGKTDQLIREGRLDEVYKQHPDITDPKALYEMSLGAADQLVEMKSDWEAFKIGAKTGAGLGFFIPDGPLMFAGEGVGAIVGGTSAVALKRWTNFKLKTLLARGAKWILGDNGQPELAVVGGDGNFFNVQKQFDEIDNYIYKSTGKIPNQKGITPNITKRNEKALKKMGLWEYFREFNVDEFGGKVTRTESGAIVSPEHTGFSKATAERLGKLPELRSFYENLTDMDILAELDHINPLKLTAYLMNKTTGTQRVKLRKILLEEGINYGDMIKNMQALPREVHAVWTRNMNRVMGKQLDTFLAEMSTLGITKPTDIAREYAKRIKLQRSKFNKIYEAHKRTYGTVTDSNVDDLVSKLDEAYELGDEWAPARTRATRRDINKDLSNLDKYPLNNLPPGKEGLQQIVDKLGLSDFKNVDLEKFSKLPLSKQMSQLKKRSGMDIDEIQELLQTSNINLQTILDLIE